MMKAPTNTTTTRGLRAGLLTVALLAAVGVGAIARGPTGFSSGPGGVTPTPPTKPAPTYHAPIDTTSPALVVYVNGPAPLYSVVVTCPTGIVCTGTTNDLNVAVLPVPLDRGLELTVLGTDVVGVPVHAGQLVSVVVD